MLKSHLAVGAIFATLSCGPASYPPLSDGGMEGNTFTDGGANGFDFDAFAAAVEAARQSVPPRHCARALRPLPVMADDVRGTTQLAVGEVLALPATALEPSGPRCGQEGFVDCPHAFNHYLYKSDGQLADALLPSAQLVVDRARSVEAVIWTPMRDGLSLAAVVTIAGALDGKLLAIGFFNSLATCPP